MSRSSQKLTQFLIAALFWVNRIFSADNEFATSDRDLSGSESVNMCPAELKSFRSALQSKNFGFPANVVGLQEEDKVYLVVDAEFNNEQARENFATPGATVFNSFGKFADIFVETEAALEKLQRADGLRWIDVAGSAVVPPLPPRVRKKGAALPVSDKIVQGGIGKTTGRGVIIAVLDTGIDFRNPDFITLDGQGRPVSRILYFWDTLSDAHLAGKRGGPAPFSYPNQRSIGTLYTNSDLTTELRSTEWQIPTWDSNGHGTACAGIAAGNGGNYADKEKRHKYCGTAPEADIIAVRIGSGPHLENAYLLNAICNWLNTVATTVEKPLVVSCSFGGHQGGHDGFRVSERQLNARFPLGAKGRAICIAAGNEGRQSIHTQALLKPGTNRIVRYRSNGQGQIALYHEGADKSDLHIGGVNQAPLGTVRHNLSQSHFTVIDLPAGDGELTLTNTSKQEFTFDAYLSGAEFDAASVSYARQICNPGTATNAITVGSYDFNDRFTRDGESYLIGIPNGQGGTAELKVGELSSYSNAGPQRTVQKQKSAVKPDIVAPGQFFIASTSFNASADLDRGQKYRIFNGTSAATPYVAGVIALLMQEKPDITLERIHELLRSNAAKDTHTGEVPNAQWGHGKLNYEAIETMLQSVRADAP